MEKDRIKTYPDPEGKLQWYKLETGEERKDFIKKCKEQGYSFERDLYIISNEEIVG